MKQIIMDVLKDMSNDQINLASEAARETVSSLISAALKAQGYNNRNKVNSYLTTDLSEEEQKARETWVCSICGENTYDVDYEYIGSCTNHLGCELKVEMREKNWLQKKHEDKVFGKPGKWREDIQNHWPYDEKGNLLPNVTTTRKL